MARHKMNPAIRAGLVSERYDIEPHVLAREIGAVVRASLRQVTEDAIARELKPGSRDVWTDLQFTKRRDQRIHQRAAGLRK